MGQPRTTTEQQAAPKRRFRWLHAATDRLPTKWIAGIGTGLFLAATAAFGGLETVEATSLPELSAGEEHRNEQLSVTVQRAVLIDELPEAGVTVESGERVLALIVDAENLWTEPLPTTRGNSVSSTVELVESPDAEPDGTARYDDTTPNPWLQPGVPATLVLAWVVAGDRFTEGDELRVQLNDETLFTGTAVVSGRYWDDPRAAAMVTVGLEDVGAGAEADGADAEDGR